MHKQYPVFLLAPCACADGSVHRPQPSLHVNSSCYARTKSANYGNILTLLESRYWTTDRYSSSKKLVTFPFHSALFGRRCTVRASRTISVLYGRGLSTCKKRKASSSTRQLESIVLYCYGLLNCSGVVHYCR